MGDALQRPELWAVSPRRAPRPDLSMCRGLARRGSFTRRSQVTAGDGHCAAACTTLGSRHFSIGTGAAYTLFATLNSLTVWSEK
jgi:hypothetical protein